MSKVSENRGRTAKPGKARIRKNTNTETFYISAPVLREQIRNFYQTDKFSKELGDSILKIVDGLASASNFSGYSYLDDMKGDAIEKIVKTINKKNFDVDANTNPFTYFTTIAYHAFCNRIKLEKVEREISEIMQEHMYEELINENLIYSDQAVVVKHRTRDED